MKLSIIEATEAGKRIELFCCSYDVYISSGENDEPDELTESVHLFEDESVSVK